MMNFLIAQNAQLMKALARAPRDRPDSESDEEESGSRRLRHFGAVRRLHRDQARDPDRVLRAFDEEIMRDLGVPPGGAWSYRDWTRRIGFGHMKGLARSHAYVGDALQLVKDGRPDQAALVMIQHMKALHQAFLDEGSWETAALHVSTPDFFRRRAYGGTEREAEVLAQYRRSVADLQRLEQTVAAGSPANPPGSSSSGPPPAAETAGPKAKSKAKAKAKGKNNKKNANAETTEA